MLRLHKGEVYKVFDKDSVSLLGYDLSKEIIDIENQAQLVARAPSIIEKLEAISGRAHYEEQGETRIVAVPVPMLISDGGDYSSGMGGIGLISTGSGNNSYQVLYKGDPV